MKIGIVIPSKNEEKHLPLLANSIIQQTYKDYTVVVSDAFSDDRTREIAKDYGFTVVDGGMPFTGRNNGAKEAINQECELLLFIDADIILPTPDFLDKSISEFNSRRLDLAGTFQKPYDLKEDNQIEESKSFKHKLIYQIANIAMSVLEKSKRPMFQVCMFATKDAHEKIGGFRSLEYGEDSRYAIDGKQKGLKFGMLRKNEKALISPRRFQEKGFINSGTPHFLLGVLLGKKFEYGKVNKKYF